MSLIEDSYKREVMQQRPKTSASIVRPGSALRPASRPQSGFPPRTPRSHTRLTLVPELTVPESEPRFVPLRRLPTSLQNEIAIQTERDDGKQDAEQQISLNVPTDYELLPGMQRAAIAADSGNLYYQRLLEQLARENNPAVVRPRTGRGHPLKGSPIFRSGRNGASWRHIQHCIGNQGQNIMFIDGSIKEDDCRRFPPHGYPSSTVQTYSSVESRLAPRPSSVMMHATGAPRRPNTAASIQYHSNRARQGHKYWYEPRSSANKSIPYTIQGRIMKFGTAY